MKKCLVSFLLALLFCILSCSALGEGDGLRTLSLGDFQYAIPMEWIFGEEKSDGSRTHFGSDGVGVEDGYLYAQVESFDRELDKTKDDAQDFLTEFFGELIKNSKSENDSYHFVEIDGMYGMVGTKNTMSDFDVYFTNFALVIKGRNIFFLAFIQPSVEQRAQSEMFSYIVNTIRFTGSDTTDPYQSNKPSQTERPAPAYPQELVFQEIPWGTNILELKKALVAKGVASKKTDYDLDAYLYTMNLGPDARKSAGKGLGASISVYSVPKDYKIAGYHAKKIYAYCHYDYGESAIYREPEKSKFFLIEIEIDVTDTESTYNDLNDKLTTLYGVPEEISDKTGYFSTGGDYDQYEKWSIWQGANSTAISLYWTHDVVIADGSINDDKVTLSYGKLDSIVVLSELKEVDRLEKIAEDQNEIEKNKGNTDGL